MYRKIGLFFGLLLSSYSSLFCDEPKDLPWLTSPLLVTNGEVTAAPYWNLEPYLYYIVNTGLYDHHWNAHSIPSFHQLNPQLIFRLGITKRADFSGVIQFFYNFTQGEHTTNFGDLPLGFDIQLINREDLKDSLLPEVKFTFQEVFPTGVFDRLDPKRKLTDVSGGGAYGSLLALTFYKVFHLSGVHYFAYTLSFNDIIYIPTHVRGLNAYGGDETTRGTVRPGNLFTIFYGGELTLTKNWVLACEVVTAFRQKSPFHGTTSVHTGLPPSTLISFAPEIEYNFSHNFGIIAGYWLSLVGRNNTRFHSGIIAASYVF